MLENPIIIYLRRNQYLRKFLRWRDLPQYLTSFCCKALHLRCLWGYYYASVHCLLRQLFYTKKHYFIVNFSVNLYRNFGSKNWFPLNYGKHLKNILQPINSFKVIKYLKVIRIFFSSTIRHNYLCEGCQYTKIEWKEDFTLTQPAFSCRN